jgi:hypothetical protein
MDCAAILSLFISCAEMDAQCFHGRKFTKKQSKFQHCSSKHVKLPLCLIKGHAMKMYGEVDILVQILDTSRYSKGYNKV